MAVDDCIAQFMARWIRPGFCALDVGANQGGYLFQMLDLVGTSGELHAFEPNPELAAILRQRGQDVR